MFVLYLFLTIVDIFVVFLMSVFLVVCFWWLLFFKRGDRIRMSNYLLYGPWVLLVNHLLLFINLKLIGKENIDPTRKTLYICNHQSWLDIITFVRESKAGAISKEEVKSIPLIGLLTQYAGTLYFKRENRGDRIGIIKEVRKHFDAGNSLCLFPEGTRSDKGELNTPNFALIKLAYKMNITVVPAALHGTIDILPKNRLYFKFFKKVVLKYNKPIDPADYPDGEEFCKVCWGKVEDTYKEIRSKYFNLST